MDKIGVICSSNGSSFFTALDIFTKTFDILPLLITDRETRAESEATIRGIPFKRVVSGDNKQFSLEARDYFIAENNVEFVLLYYTRFVTAELFNAGTVINFHPSLLPSFPGFNALKSTLKSRVKFFGGSAHIVDETEDNGMLIAQTVMPVTHTMDSVKKFSKYAYLQKVYMSLVILEGIVNKTLTKNSGFSELHSSYTNFANPCIQNPELVSNFSKLEDMEGHYFTSIKGSDE